MCPAGVPPCSTWHNMGRTCGTSRSCATRGCAWLTADPSSAPGKTYIYLDLQSSRFRFFFLWKQVPAELLASGAACVAPCARAWTGSLFRPPLAAWCLASGESAQAGATQAASAPQTPKTQARSEPARFWLLTSEAAMQICKCKNTKPVLSYSDLQGVRSYQRGDPLFVDQKFVLCQPLRPARKRAGSWSRGTYEARGATRNFRTEVGSSTRRHPVARR
jgi:hypothetical protein